MTRADKAKSLLTLTAANWSEDNVPRLAASFSFYAILSIAPVLVLAVTVASIFLAKEEAQARLLDQVRQFVGSRDAANLVQGLISGTEKKGSGTVATLFSLLVTFFSASNLFLQLELTVNTIWGIQQKGSMIRQLVVTRVLAFLAVAVFGALILAWLALDSWLTWFDKQTPGFQGGQALSFVLTVLFFTGGLGVAYKGMPKGRTHWRDVWPGALIAAVGIAVSKLAFSAYLGYAGLSAYGAAGSLVALLLWIYYTSQIFFFGLEVTYTYTKEFGSMKGQNVGDLEYS